MQVEFIESDEPEELAAPGPPSRRSRIRAGLVLVLVAALALVVADLRGGNGRPAPSTAPTTATRSLPPGTGILLGEWPTVSVDADHCPEEGICAASPSVSAVARSAVSDVFPTARFGAGTTTTSGGSLWYRELNVRTGEFTLVLRIERPRSVAGDQGLTTVDRATHSVTVRRLLASYVVQIQVTGPAHAALPIAAVSRLASDHRLLLG